MLCSELAVLRAHCPAPCRLPRMTTPQDLDACSPPQMAVLYHKAHMAFQNVSGSEYFTRIKPFLGEPGKIQGK